MSSKKALVVPMKAGKNVIPFTTRRDYAGIVSRNKTNVCISTSHTAQTVFPVKSHEARCKNQSSIKSVTQSKLKVYAQHTVAMAYPLTSHGVQTRQSFSLLHWGQRSWYLEAMRGALHDRDIQQNNHPCMFMGPCLVSHQKKKTATMHSKFSYSSSFMVMKVMVVKFTFVDEQVARWPKRARS